MSYDYLLLTASVVIFGIQFLLSDLYQRESGTSLVSVFIYTFLCATAGAVCLLFLNGFQLLLTPFTAFLSLLAALNLIFNSICSLRALEKVDLSKYSLFSMLGGMLLPSVYGIFCGEALTLAKIFCTVLIVGSLLLTLQSGEKAAGGVPYYVGVFVSNGLSGVFSKIHTDVMLAGRIPTADSAGYTIWLSLFSALISMVALVFLWRRFRMPSVKTLLLGVGNGVLNKVANYLSMLALLTLPVTIQSPFLTGGIIVISTVISALTNHRPTKRDLCSVALAFLGIMVLSVVPI